MPVARVLYREAKPKETSWPWETCSLKLSGPQENCGGVRTVLVCTSASEIWAKVNCLKLELNKQHSRSQGHKDMTEEVIPIFEMMTLHKVYPKDEICPKNVSPSEHLVPGAAGRWTCGTFPCLFLTDFSSEGQTTLKTIDRLYNGY